MNGAGANRWTPEVYLGAPPIRHQPNNPPPFLVTSSTNQPSSLTFFNQRNLNQSLDTQSSNYLHLSRNNHPIAFPRCQVWSSATISPLFHLSFRSIVVRPVSVMIQDYLRCGEVCRFCYKYWIGSLSPCFV